MEKAFIHEMKEELIKQKELIIKNLAAENEEFRELIEDKDPKDFADIASDDIDKKIVSRLQLDGRTTFNELAKMVDFSSMGAKKRVEKLLRNNTIRISALVNAEQLNLQAAVVLIEMEDGEAMQRLLDRFAECPRVVHIFTTLGGYNIIAYWIELRPPDSFSTP